MDHKQFVTRLQKRLSPMPKNEVNAMLSHLAEIIKDSALKMDSIAIQGFGTFEPRKKLERISVNPATGKRMLVPPKMVLTFKPSTQIKNNLKEKISDGE